jgi:hypothetical protein
VNVASLNGCLSFKLLPSLAHTTNKAAIIGMTRQLALEGSEHGIRVNSISPGFIEINSTRGELEDEEFGRQMRDRTLLGRFGQAEDIANAALYLASDESSYITGIDLVVDGGIKGLVTAVVVPQKRGPMPAVDASAEPAARRRRPGSGFWAVAFAFLIVTAFATVPSPLYGLYRTRDNLSAFTITVICGVSGLNRGAAGAVPVPGQPGPGPLRGSGYFL